MAVDYMYAGSNQKEGEGGLMPIMVYKDLTSPRGGKGMVFARAVQNIFLKVKTKIHFINTILNN